jgi:hypothetical protein
MVRATELPESSVVEALIVKRTSDVGSTLGSGVGAVGPPLAESLGSSPSPVSGSQAVSRRRDAAASPTIAAALRRLMPLPLAHQYLSRS